MGVLSSPLNGKTFVFELGRDVRFKAKQELINYLREQNAQISYILTASVGFSSSLYSLCKSSSIKLRFNLDGLRFGLE